MSLLELRFEEFWEKYHRLSKKPKTDKHQAFMHWKKLKAKEKILATEKIEDFIKQNGPDPKYIKKARTYLKDKNFNDEFAISPTTKKPTGMDSWGNPL